MVVLIGLPKTSYSQTLSITEIQRDSIYNKIERGKANAQQVKDLRSALNECALQKKLKDDFSALQKAQLSDKDTIIANNKKSIKNLEESVKAEQKRGRKRGFFNVLKGIGIGVGLTTLGLISL